MDRFSSEKPSVKSPHLIALECFFGIIMIGMIYVTTLFHITILWIIEENLGLSKSTKKLFWTDKLKGWE